MTAAGLILSAMRSGEGKTVVATALIAALRRRGFAVGGAKSGPDYIDPAFHRAAAGGRPSLNLDSWAMPPPLLDRLAAEAAYGADLLVVEGALGLYDGVAGPADRRGATADLAVRYGWPVVPVLDVSGQSQTVAAILRGLVAHDPRLFIGGVILNRVAGGRHQRLIGEAVEPLGIPILGVLPRDAALSLPSRHLGLVQAGEHSDLEAKIEALAALAERHLDVEALATLARRSAVPAPAAVPALPPPGKRIAVADDAAFSFLYPHVAASWREAGATIHPFSPLADAPPPEDCDACWLPGGYPELHAPRLAAAGRFLDGLRRFAATRPVHGECGGYMVLGEALIDADGNAHRMAGLLSHSTSFAARRLNLGYREAVIEAPSLFGAAGTRVRGHEFHYSTIASAGQDEPFATVSDARGEALGAAGSRRGLVSGSYFHMIAPAP